MFNLYNIYEGDHNSLSWQGPLNIIASIEKYCLPKRAVCVVKYISGHIPPIGSAVHGAVYAICRFEEEEGVRVGVEQETHQ